MADPTSFTWALYQGAWLPCRLLEEDKAGETIRVRVIDRTGTHEVWLPKSQVRGQPQHENSE